MFIQLYWCALSFTSKAERRGSPASGLLRSRVQPRR